MAVGEYVVDVGSGKMVLQFNKADYLALPQTQRDEIKRYFNFSRYQSGWVSKGQADSYMPQEIAKKLGFSKAGESGEKRSFAEQMDAKAERAEARSERYSEYSEKAEKRAENLQKEFNSLRGDIAFMTQPITPGAGGQRFKRYKDKLIARYEKGWDEQRKAEYFKEQSARLGNVASQTELQDKRYLDNRIKENEATLRKLEKSIKSPDTYNATPEQTAEYVERMEDRAEETREKLDFYKVALDRLGGVAYNSSNVARGDRVKIRHGWAIVKSVGPKNIEVVIASGGAIGMELKYPYAEIQEFKKGTPPPTDLPQGYRLEENPKAKGGGYEIRDPNNYYVGLRMTKTKAIDLANVYENEHHLSHSTKEPWQMTQAELRSQLRPKIDTIPYQHEEAVKRALSEGKPVPAEVLKDYPELSTQKYKDDYRIWAESGWKGEAPKEPGDISKDYLFELRNEIKQDIHRKLQSQPQVVNLPEHKGKYEDERKPVAFATRTIKMNVDKDPELELVRQTYPIMGRSDKEKPDRISGGKMPRITPKMPRLR
jgi:hypothetical protein